MTPTKTVLSLARERRVEPVSPSDADPRGAQPYIPVASDPSTASERVVNRRGNAGGLARGLGRIYLRCLGWKVEGELPGGTKAVVIAAPHTSNWDLPFMLAVAYVLGVKPSWLGKRELFRGPFGWLMRRLGGVPVHRDRRTNLVQQAIDHFDSVDQLFLVIPPSGTRRQATHWKSGFYHIARGAGVPIICTFLDYRRKVGGVGPVITASDDVRADMEIIRAFYTPAMAKYPHVVTPVRLLDEDAPNLAQSSG